MAEEYAAVHQSTTLPTAGPTPGKNTLTGGSVESLMMGVFDQRPERFNPVLGDRRVEAYPRTKLFWLLNRGLLGEI